MTGNIIGAIGIIFLLWAGKPLLLPLVMAIFFWYLTKAIAVYYKKIVRSDAAAHILSGATLLGVMYFFLVQIHPMLAGLYVKMPEIAAGLERVSANLAEMIGIEITFANFPNLHDVLSNIGSAAAGIGAAFLMIVVYILFLFVEQGTFSKKLVALFPSKRQLNKISFIISSIDCHMRKYLFVKTGISFATALFSYLGMLVLGVDFAIVWAFFVFLLNYIPTIGSIIAGALPTLYVFALTGDVRTPLLVALWIGFVNLIFGNILDPRLTGRSLNLSALVILVNMVFWGMLWGPVGMFFSVPILVMTYVAFAQFDKTRWIAILLSADGNIPDKNED